MIKTIENDLDYLRQVSNKVDFKDSSYLNDIDVLERYCIENEVFAMAAIQLGINKRIIYLKNTDLNKIEDKEWNEGKILINPVIIKRIGLTKYWEACASCLDNMGLVKRPYSITIKYFDEKQNEKIDVFEGFEATVLSHEYDHLNGVLHMDIAEEIINMPKEERKEFRKVHNYEVLSKTIDYEGEKKKYESKSIFYKRNK